MSWWCHHYIILSNNHYFTANWPFLETLIPGFDISAISAWMGEELGDGPGGGMGYKLPATHTLSVQTHSKVASLTVILKTSLSRALNHQNKHRNTNQNTIAAILWVFISFSSVLKLLNFGFSSANLNRHGHWMHSPPHKQRMVSLWSNHFVNYNSLERGNQSNYLFICLFRRQ